MNAVLATARAAGSTIIHAPSGCLDFYEGTAARRRAQEAPAAPDSPEGLRDGVLKIDAEPGDGDDASAQGCVEGGYPIDQRDGGEDDDPLEHAAWAALLADAGRDPGHPWIRQTAALDIDDDCERDYVTDSGEETWNILAARGIANVVLMGVHTNMCVIGRPFGLRQVRPPPLSP